MSDTPREQLTLELRRSPQPIPDAALAWFATFLRSDEARQIMHRHTCAAFGCEGACTEVFGCIYDERTVRGLAALADKVEGKP